MHDRTAARRTRPPASRHRPLGATLAALLLVAGAAFSTPVAAQQPPVAEPPAGSSPDAGPDLDTLVGLLELLLDADPDSARKSLVLIADQVRSRELAGASLAALRPRLDKLLDPLLAGPADRPLYDEAVGLAAALGNPRGLAAMRRIAADRKASDETRRRAVETLAFAGDRELLALLPRLLSDPAAGSSELRAAWLAALNRWDEPQVATVVLELYPRLEPELQPRAVELLTQRAVWAKSLLGAVAAKRLPAAALNANQVARLQTARDPELVALVERQWGKVRLERNPAREQVIADVKRLLAERSGDPRRGRQVFARVCGQCHKIYGEGQEVGPDLTANGRSSVEQLLSNVLDPSLVIGASYQARTVVAADGRVLTGLLTEDGEQRVVLKMQGGKLETIARDDVEELRVSPLSMMPEGLETQLKPDELVDLFAFLMLDKPPDDPSARRIPAAPPAEPSPRQGGTSAPPARP